MKEFPSTLCAGLCLLLLVAAISGGMHAWMSAVDLTAESLAVSPVAQQARDEGVPVVSTVEVAAIVESGSHLLLDARPLAEYDQGHLPTAMSLPLEDFESAFPAIAPMLTETDPILVYCSGPLCDDALRLALRLREAGFPDVSLYLDGWEGWR